MTGNFNFIMLNSNQETGMIIFIGPIEGINLSQKKKKGEGINYKFLIGVYGKQNSLISN